MAESYRPGLPPVFTANSILSPGRALRPFSTAKRTKARPVDVEYGEGIVRQDFTPYVLGQEPTGVVAESPSSSA